MQSFNISVCKKYAALPISLSVTGFAILQDQNDSNNRLIYLTAGVKVVNTKTSAYENGFCKPSPYHKTPS